MRGGCFSFSFPDIEKVKEKQFSSNAPAFRHVTPGLNFDAVCPKCKERVIIQIGYNKNGKDYFDIGSMRNHLKCTNSNCKAKINPNGLKNIILYKSIWKYEYQLKDEDNAQSGLAFNQNDRNIYYSSRSR